MGSGSNRAAKRKAVRPRAPTARARRRTDALHPLSTARAQDGAPKTRKQHLMYKKKALVDVLRQLKERGFSSLGADAQMKSLIPHAAAEALGLLELIEAPTDAPQWQ